MHPVRKMSMDQSADIGYVARGSELGSRERGQRMNIYVVDAANNKESKRLHMILD